MLGVSKYDTHLLKTQIKDSVSMTQLVNGKIPAKQDCPFRKECPTAASQMCKHTGAEHTVAFSCGAARLFAILERTKK